MKHIVGATLPIKPADVHAYIDHVQFWSRDPASQQELQRVRESCGSIHSANGPSRFDARYVQRIQLKQPTSEALRWAASRPDVIINMLELTLDLIFTSAREADQALEFLDYSLVRRWHGRKQKVARIDRTRYDASRSAKNKTVLYPEHYSRVTGELNCVHLEWRIQSARAVRSIGVQHFKDLMNFNHRKFWEKRLVLYAADAERVGRYFRNLCENGKSRSVHKLDSRKGQVVLNGVDCIQELVDTFRSIRLQRVLTSFDVSGLLPRVDVEWAV